MVEVSDDNKTWEKRELLTVLHEDIDGKYVTGTWLNVQETILWKYARPIKKNVELLR